jgi:phosphoribosylformylglycinamidine (FGAM) synthase PurS component
VARPRLRHAQANRERSQGLAIRGGLHHLGFESVESVRAGKYLELRLDQLDEGRAGGRVDAMSRPRLKAP